MSTGLRDGVGEGARIGELCYGPPPIQMKAIKEGSMAHRKMLIATGLLITGVLFVCMLLAVEFFAVESEEHEGEPEALAQLR